MSAAADPQSLEARLLEERLNAHGDETVQPFTLPVAFDLAGILSIIGLLQLALRHPGVDARGPAARIVQAFIDESAKALEDHAYPAHAELIRLGDKPANDVAV